ncbi:hypothetical protein [Corynebacterium atypicum]|uniref:hypothetical protein n=1 Tax=Corynebacterium atypicum TaxID=191610 RepID=UPI001F3811D7|nr:hypothetical protein [Corynebacterium atypicum]
MVSAWKKADKESGAAASPWARAQAHRNELQTALSSLSPAGDAAGLPHGGLNFLYRLVLQTFGFTAPEPVVFSRGEAGLKVQASVDPAQSVAVLLAEPAGSHEDVFSVGLLCQPVELSLAQEAATAKPLDGLTAAKVAGDVFLADDPPRFQLILAGRWVVLAERESWPLGRYLAVDLALAVERADTRARGELERVGAALARENLERAPDGTTWWLGTIEESREHSVGVSGDLREAVRASIEVIGNDVLLRRRARGLAVLPSEGVARSGEAAAGLGGGHDAVGMDGQELAHQALRYLYRILVVLFAEARPELEILPVGDPDYEAGYGLAHLRERVLVDPETQTAAQGTYLYQSLNLLFGLIDAGHDPQDSSAPGFFAGAPQPGLTFRNLSADLFLPQATGLIDQVGLSNAALAKVLRNLLLTKEKKGRDRGFISYATLGVTELGQVYEGLMSFTGSIAAEELVEVAPKGNPSKGSWLLPRRVVDHDPQAVPADSFVEELVPHAMGGVHRKRKVYPAGSFVFRQSSRDRERSASFYTPGVLTEFTVAQAIEVLRAEGRIACARDVLELKLLEPALGSGAFAVEATNQLAELYLSLREGELGRKVPPEDRPRELQRVKARIAVHQVYGVDLNATAVELAEVSLCLDTMTAELKAPWFGLHLRRGNSLIGAERLTYTVTEAEQRKFFELTPRRQPLRLGSTQARTAGEAIRPAFDADANIFHFLLPTSGWGAAAQAKEIKGIAAGPAKMLRAWSKQMTRKLTKAEVTKAAALTERAEKLWQLALVRLEIAESHAARRVTVWGEETGATGGGAGPGAAEGQPGTCGDGPRRGGGHPRADRRGAAAQRPRGLRAPALCDGPVERAVVLAGH